MAGSSSVESLSSVSGSDSEDNKGSSNLSSHDSDSDSYRGEEKPQDKADEKAASAGDAAGDANATSGQETEGASKTAGDTEKKEEGRDRSGSNSSASSSKSSKSSASSKKSSRKSSSASSHSSSSSSLSDAPMPIDDFLSAAQDGKLDVIEAGIKSGVDVNASDGNGWSSLHHASWSGHSKIVEHLVSSEVDATKSLPSESLWGALTALHLASSAGHPECVRALLKHDQSLAQAVDGKARTALHIAASGGHADVVAMLVEPVKEGSPVPYLSSPDNTGDTPLHHAVRADSVGVTEALLAQGADRDATSSSQNSGSPQTPYKLATELGHTDVANLLAPVTASDAASDAGSDASSNLSTTNARPPAATTTDADQGNEDAAPPPKDDAPMTPRRQKQRSSPGTTFVERYHKAFPADKRSELVNAAIADNAEQSTSLCKDGDAKPDDRDDQGWTALHHACWHGSARAADALAQRGALMTNAVWDGMRPLHLAAMSKHVECIQVCLDHHANVNASNGHLQTSLHVAAREGAADCVEALLNAKATVVGSDNEGNTALHCAVLGDSLECVQLLLDHRASVGARNSDEHTPRLVALYAGLPNGDAIMNAMSVHESAAGGPRSPRSRHKPDSDRASKRTAQIYLNDGVTVEEEDANKRAHRPLHRSNKVTPLGPLPGQSGGAQASPRRRTRGHKNQPPIRKGGRKEKTPSFQPKVNSPSTFQRSPYHSSTFPSWIDSTIKRAGASRYLTRPNYAGDPGDNALIKAGAKTPRKRRGKGKKKSGEEGEQDGDRAQGGGDGKALSRDSGKGANGEGNGDAVTVPRTQEEAREDDTASEGEGAADGNGDTAAKDGSADQGGLDDDGDQEEV